jgi:hypothetical protein
MSSVQSQWLMVDDYMERTTIIMGNPVVWPTNVNENFADTVELLQVILLRPAHRLRCRYLGDENLGDTIDILGLPVTTFMVRTTCYPIYQPDILGNSM